MLPLAAAALLVGAITLTYPAGTQSATALEVEVRFGPLVAGSSAGQNASDASASVAGSLLSLRTNMLYLNNTNATGAWYVKIASASTSGLANVVSVTVGIDNGTADTAQVVGALGALTQTEGAYTRLEPASANRIYLTQAVSSLLAPDTVLALDVHASDSATGDAYVITNANLTLT